MVQQGCAVLMGGKHRSVTGHKILRACCTHLRVLYKASTKLWGSFVIDANAKSVHRKLRYAVACAYYAYTLK